MVKKKSKPVKVQYKLRKTVSHRDWGKVDDVPWATIPAGTVVDAETFAHLTHHEVNLLVESGTLEIIEVANEEPIAEEESDG